MFLKKSYGQHLLTSEPTLEKIVRILNSSSDSTVIEIGPGTGNLTKHLLARAGRVIAIEKDTEMIEVLQKKFSNEKLQVIHQDILEVNFQKIIPSGEKVLFAGNLPYNISTPILFKLSENRQLFKRGIVMVQREVAKRMVARPGSKDYGILSILMQVVAKLKKDFDIAPGAFLPPPKVTSSVVSIEFPEKPPYEIKDYDLFAKLVKSSFGKRRKMIRNSLPEEYLFALQLAGINETDRPEDLSIEQFIKLSNCCLDN